MFFSIKRTVNKRYFEDNDGQLYLEREKRLWWFPFFIWWFELHESLDKKALLIEAKIEKKTNEIRELLGDLEEELRQLQIEKEEVRKSPRTRKGYSEPFREKCKWFFGKPIFPRKSSGKWRGALNPKLLSQFDLKQGIKNSVRDRINQGEHLDSNITGIVLKEHAPFVASGLDGFNQMETLDLDRNQSNKKGKGKNKHWKNQRSGEDDYAYQERMRRGNPDGQGDDY